MAPRKKARKHKGATRKSRPSTAVRWPSFIAGIMAGIVLSLGGMYIYASGMKMTLGAGIKTLLKAERLFQML
jgi:hypothetical protein